MFNQKEYSQKHKEQIKATSKEWRSKNIEHCKKCKKEWEKENKEHVKEYSRKYREKNKEHIKEYYQKNKLKQQTYAKEWRKTENGKAANQRGHAKRRAREREIINTLKSQEWLDILEEYNYRCAYCDVEFEVENMPERDHVIPISKGGNNIKENIAPACRSCNAKKNDSKE